MNGVELAKNLRKQYPQLQVIFASGYGHALGGLDTLDAFVITKPFDLSKLESVVREVEKALVE